MNKSEIYIDRRPLPLLFIIKYRNALLLLLSFVIFIGFMTLGTNPEGLSIKAYRALIIFIFAIFLWSTNIIPLPITSLMIMAILATFEVLEPSKIYSFFGNESLFFIIGAFFISAGISTSGLSKRLSYFVISNFGSTPYSLVLSIFFLSAIMSHIMPIHAVAALVFPILVSIAKQLNLQSSSILGKYMFYALAWGATIGGVVTFLGGARNPLAVGILTETTGTSIGFLEWMIAVAPPAYLLLFIVAAYMKRELKYSTKDTKLLEDILNSNKQRIGKISFQEIKTIFIFSGTIYMWIFHSSRLGIANIALLSAALFFVLNVMTWDDAKNEINWGPVFMYGGAIAIGKSLGETGLLTYISESYISNLGLVPITFILLIFTVSLFLTEGISNAAVIVILLPVVLEIVSGFGLTPKLATYLVAVPSGLAFMFPMGSPPNAIAFSSGYIILNESIRKGLVLNIMAVTIFTVFALLYWPLIGVY